MSTGDITKIPTVPSQQEMQSPNKGSGVQPPDPLLPGGYGVGQGYEPGDGFRLSAKTCLAFLPRLSEKELDDEIDFIKAYHADLAVRTRVKGVDGKRAYLEGLLNNTFRNEYFRFAEAGSTV